MILSYFFNSTGASLSLTAYPTLLNDWAMPNSGLSEVVDTFDMLSLYEERMVRNTILSGTYGSEALNMGFSIGYKF